MFRYGVILHHGIGSILGSESLLFFQKSVQIKWIISFEGVRKFLIFLVDLLSCSLDSFWVSFPGLPASEPFLHDNCGELLLFSFECFHFFCLFLNINHPWDRVGSDSGVLDRSVVDLSFVFLLFYRLFIIWFIQSTGLVILLVLRRSLLKVKNIVLRWSCIEIDAILLPLSVDNIVVAIVTMDSVPVISHTLHFLKLKRYHAVAWKLSPQ